MSFSGSYNHKSGSDSNVLDVNDVINNIPNYQPPIGCSPSDFALLVKLHDRKNPGLPITQFRQLLTRMAICSECESVVLGSYKHRCVKRPRLQAEIIDLTGESTEEEDGV